MLSLYDTIKQKEVDMANKIIIFSGKQYSGKDTAAKIMLAEMPDYKRCAMGDIIKLTYGQNTV